MFQELRLEDRALFQQFFSLKQYPHSQYNFTNLFMWHPMMQFAYQVVDGFLCVVAQKDPQHPLVFFPVGEGDLQKPLSFLMEQFGPGMTMVGVSQEMRRALEEAVSFPFTAQDHRSSYDYVYAQTSLDTLAGKKLHGKRNHIRRFQNQYNYSFFPLEEKWLPACRQLELDWIASRQDWTDQEKELECLATMRVIDHFQDLGCRGGILLVEEQPVAFSIGEMITQDTALIHVEKADTFFEGSYPMINQLMCREVFSDATWINREEDMGLESLRKAKLSYYPDHFNEIQKIVFGETHED